MSTIVAIGLRRGRGRPPGSRDRSGRADPVDHRARSMAAWRSMCVSFGLRLRALCDEQDISARELASAIGGSKQTIMSWWRGRSIPSMPVLFMVAAALRCSLVDLMPHEAHYRAFPVVDQCVERAA